MSLTDKQIKFAECYSIHCNATKAAIEAGYSQDSAASIGAENLRKNEIRKLIDEQMEKFAKECFLHKYRVIIELSRYAFRDDENAYKDVKPREAILALSKIGEILGLWESAEAKTKAEREALLLQQEHEKDLRDKERREHDKKYFPTVAHFLK